jgi:hypothetical protein
MKGNRPLDIVLLGVPDPHHVNITLSASTIASKCRSPNDCSSEFDLTPDLPLLEEDFLIPPDFASQSE